MITSVTHRTHVPQSAPTPVAPAQAGTEADDATPWINPDVIASRIARGRIAEHSSDQLPPGVIQRGAPQYFRTYEQVRSAMLELQQRFPDLVQVRDIGDSWEKTQGTADRDILAITLTNRNAPGSKPVVTHIAGVHAREIANPELLMTWAVQLLEGYGRDPEATALLNSREIDLVPIVNPDGHAVIERAYASQPGGNLMKRKNTSGPGGQGTDINRNFEFHWGGAGASPNPSSDTYRGAHAASEPETRSIQEFVKSRRPSMFVDWHSYSKLNMYPWGDTKDKTPDHEGFKAVAERFSALNHYSPIQAVQLYPTTGTTDDTAYGMYGVPAWAVETGDSFHQSDQEFGRTLSENLPVLWYGAKIANRPFDRVKGPDALDVLVDAANGRISARVSDALNGKQAIAGAELVLDPAAQPGSGTPLAAADGTFDSPTEQVAGSLRLPAGMQPTDGQLAYVRARDAAGNWGPLTAQWITGPAPAALQTAAAGALLPRR
jgi:carboxypeptidase T